MYEESEEKKKGIRLPSSQRLIVSDSMGAEGFVVHPSARLLVALGFFQILVGTIVSIIPEPHWLIYREYQSALIHLQSIRICILLLNVNSCQLMYNVSY